MRVYFARRRAAYFFTYLWISISKSVDSKSAVARLEFHFTRWITEIPRNDFNLHNSPAWAEVYKRRYTSFNVYQSWFMHAVKTRVNTVRCCRVKARWSSLGKLVQIHTHTHSWETVGTARRLKKKGKTPLAGSLWYGNVKRKTKGTTKLDMEI